nr:ribonuclease H-like domain, reverse transcriptase, RNA-dependent DNA polymerase [Tanacetum cinerariifolium]
MVAILKKGEFNSDFHPMVDFLAASPLRTVSESSLWRNLKLRDEDGIVSIPDMELFENLTLIGPKSTGFNEFSSNIATALVCLATNRTYNFSKMIFDGMVKDINNKTSKFLMYPRIVPLFDTKLEHQGEGSGTPTEPHHIPSPEADTSHPTTSSIPLPSIPTAPIPPDRATIAKSSTLPHDSAPRVTSPAANKGSMQHNISELTTLCTSLQRKYSELLAKFQAKEEEIDKLKDRVKVLEDKEDVVVTLSGDDTPIKGRSINKGETAAKRISNNSEEVARVLTSMDAATVLAGGIDVPTGSGFIPTDGPPDTVISTGSEVGPTSSPIVTRRKGKEVMVESDTPKKKKLQEQIDAQVEDFFPMGSKEESERLKRKGLNLEKEQVKKQKSSEEAPEIETSIEEFTEEKMKEMMQLVPVEDVYVQSL